MQNLQARIKAVPLLFIVLFYAPLLFAQQPKKIRTIIVDAGHGGTDAGARGEYEGTLGSLEKNITLAISTKLVAELKKQLPGKLYQKLVRQQLSQQVCLPVHLHILPVSYILKLLPALALPD